MGEAATGRPGPDRPGAHRLGAVAFDALAAGRPDAATVALLRRAQLSRNLLLLRGIVRAAPSTTSHWYGDLADTERRAPHAVREALTYPLFGAWAASCLAALRAGVPPDRAGAGHLALVAADAAGRSAQPRPHRLIAEHDGLRLSVLLDDVHPMRSRLGLTPAAPLTGHAVTHWQELLRTAWRELVTRHRPYARVVGAVLTCVVPVEPDGTARGISATSADAFGAIAMSDPADATALAVGLLHETQHSLLNAVQYLFDLHVHSDRSTYSPWRDDPRPAYGLLHGAYAYLAVTDFWRVGCAAGDRIAAFEFARWRAAVLSATESLLDGSALTPAGTRFVTALRSRVLPWRAVPVPPDVLRLAEGANADHHLRWRLRNLVVDQTGVRSMAAAWRAGASPPPGTIGVTVRPAARRLESNARLDLAHRTVRNDLTASASGTGSNGDRAYLRGDLAAAARAYRTAVLRDPGDDAAWSGLALTCDDLPQNHMLRERIEIVAAVHRAAATAPGTVPDPITLASWITAAA